MLGRPLACLRIASAPEARDMLMKDPTLTDNREIRARLFELVFVLAGAVLTVMQAPQGQREKLW